MDTRYCPMQRVMRPRRLIAVALLCAGVLPAGGLNAAEREPTYVFVKIDGTLAERDADVARCRDIARAAPVEDLPQNGAPIGGAVGAPDVATAVGVSLGFAIVNALQNRGARDRAELVCLRNLGYLPIELTADEAGAYAVLTKNRQEQWEREFAASDLTGRFPSTDEVVPPLPSYRAEIATQGGIRVDLDSLAASTESVAADGVALTGMVTRWRTATLVEPFATTEGRVRIAAKAGTVFHQVDHRPQRSALLRTQGATWCGPVEHLTDGSVGAPDVYCFTSQADGYDVFRPSGYEWLAGPHRGGLVLPRFREPILLEERPSDDLEPFALEIKAASVSPQLALEAYAVRAGRRVLLWERRLRYDDSGETVLPLWTKRAVFAKEPTKAVRVRLEDGDGQSWRDGD